MSVSPNPSTSASEVSSAPSPAADRGDDRRAGAASRKPRRRRTLYAASAAAFRWVHLYVSMLGFAMLKGQLIGDYYMGLRWTTGLWRWAIVLWLAIPGALIATAFVLAARGGG